MRFKQGRSIETIAALLLFAAAAVLMCGVVAFGAEGYAAVRKNTQTDAETAVQYIATKVRASDVDGGVEVSDDRICLHEFYGDDHEYDYVTELYIYDGYLRELYHDVEVELDDADGMAVLPAEKLDCRSVAASPDGSLLTFEVTVGGDGDCRTAVFSPRCGAVDAGLSGNGGAK